VHVVAESFVDLTGELPLLSRGEDDVVGAAPVRAQMELPLHSRDFH